MAVQSIPLEFPGLSNFRYSIVIGGTTFILVFQYLPRPDSWYIEVRASDETVLRNGIRVVVGFPLLGRDVDERLFDGVLFVIRKDGETRDPGREDFGDGSVSLLVITGEDLEFEDTGEETESLLIEAVP